MNMFGLFRKKNSPSNQETADLLKEHTKSLADTIRMDFQHRFEELNGNIKELSAELKSLETKLLVKDLRDKQQYGHLHYKIHEVKNDGLEKDIDDLKNKLNKDIV